MKKHKYDDINSFFSTQLTNYDLATESLLIGSCHGLVCFSSNQPRSPDFLIINPSTGERHTLARRTSHDDELIAYGFGYDKLSDYYKVVRILQTSSDDPHINHSFSAEIYGVRSKGFFRTIPLFDSDWIEINFCKFMGVFSDSSLHWCTWISDNDEQVIHAIDIVSDTYRQLHLPEATFGGSWCLNLGIVDRRLCLSDMRLDERKINIWVMEEYWNSESWNMIYCIKNVEPFDVNPMGSDGDKIFLILNGFTFFWGDSTKNNVDGTTIDIGGEGSYHESYEAIFCLESLVKIFSNDKRK
ncbi:F-box protein CPR1 [Linum grandiflorum]